MLSSRLVFSRFYQSYLDIVCFLVTVFVNKIHQFLNFVRNFNQSFCLSPIRRFFEPTESFLGFDMGKLKYFFMHIWYKKIVLKYYYKK